MSAVDHPAHYNNGKYECLAVMEDVFGKEAVNHFCQCNAFKYLWRFEKKNGLEDLKKAKFYLDYLIYNKEIDEVLPDVHE